MYTITQRVMSFYVHLLGVEPTEQDFVSYYYYVARKRCKELNA